MSISTSSGTIREVHLQVLLPWETSTCICTGGLQTWFHNKLAGRCYHHLYRWDEYSKTQALCSSSADAAGDWQGCHPVPSLTRVRTVGLLSLHRNTSLPLSDMSLPWFSSTSEPIETWCDWTTSRTKSLAGSSVNWRQNSKKLVWR